MSCSENCNPCKARDNYICHGDFYTTGEYAETIADYDIHGVSFNQKVDSVKHLLDNDTIQILKVLLQDNEHPYTTYHALEVIYALNRIQSRLSNDNKTENEVFNNSYHSGSDNDA